MFQIHDYVMYKREVCKIVEFKEKYIKDKDYYVLIPVSDESLKIIVQVDSPFLKQLMTKEEIETLIHQMPLIPIIECNTKLIENEYKNLLSTEKYEDLVRIIKTTYFRNKERLNQHKKISDKDQYYFLKAENYLYQEIGLVLGMNIDEVRNYLIDRVSLLDHS